MHYYFELHLAQCLDLISL
ncbi:UNVERIFIED_CONTAM: hypothetical protein GTU68_057956 [Idotea baltica]|nr:hypothetical protein [Idotea baltica]